MSLRILAPDGEAQHPVTTHFTPTRSQRLRAARAYAERGRPVFPCRPDKSPYTKHGFKDATTDPRKIHMWWSRWPNANIGMPTGNSSGVWVLDVDRLEALGELGRELPNTRTVLTPRGGTHFYFRHHEGITNRPGTLPKGIDVRGEGGYVLVPPSNGYRVENREDVAEAPEWLLETVKERVSQGREPARGNGHGKICGETIPEGSRNRTLFFEALALKDAGKTTEEVLGELLAVNDARCAPPLQAGEVEKIAGSAVRYPIRGRQTDPKVEEFLRNAWRRFYEESLPKGGRSKKRDCERVLLEFGERVGYFVEVIVDGEVRRAVAVSLSARQGAIPAATSHMSFARAMLRLEAEGKVMRGTDERREDHSETWLVLDPATKCYTLALSPDARGVTPCRAPQETPCFRWRHPVGNSRGGTLVAVEMYPGRSSEELAEIMGYSRARDFERNHLDVLGQRGDLVERDGRYYTPENYRERMETERHTSYSASKRRRTTVEPDGRTTRWVEYGPELSDVERDARDRERYKEQQRKFREELERRKRRSYQDPANSPESMRPVAVNLIPPADGEIRELESVEPCIHDVPGDPSMRMTRAECWLCRRKGA